MTIKKPTAVSQRPWTLMFAVAVGLSFVFLLAALLDLSTHYSVFNTQVGKSVAQEFFSIPALHGQLAFFIGALLVLHLAFAVIVWLLAMATEYSRLLPQCSRWQLLLSWFLVLSVWVLVANATLYPWSLTGNPFKLLAFDFFGAVSVFDVLTVLIMVVTLVVLWSALSRSRLRRVRVRIVVWSALSLFAGAVLYNLPSTQADGVSASRDAMPHVIVIGVDSLRSDVVGLSSSGWLAPNINGFMRDARVIPDATTPLARTFPAWVSILTGKHPQSTRARENLIPRGRLSLPPTIADHMRAAGYRTIYATDEARFNNIDSSYGFDVAVTPPLGAGDFFLGSINDLPLCNLVANTYIGKMLFPATYANRGAATTYRPETFIRSVSSALDFSRPTFLAVHFTLPHWPFHWAEDMSETFDHVTRQPYAYLSSVLAVDRQFGQLMQVLKDKGALRNSIVVVLSDHGEALGLPTDNLLHDRKVRAATGPVPVWVWGHGTSVLSPPQYSVVLAMRGYGPMVFPASANRPVNVPATLEDLAPTLLELAGVQVDEAAFDGTSLAVPVRDGGAAEESRLRDRVRFTETAFNTPSLQHGLMDRDELFKEGSYAFAINSDNGRVEFRQDRWDELLIRKERAAIYRDWLLAAIPAEMDGRHTYLLVNRRSGEPRRITAATERGGDDELATLWDALHARYPGELSSEQVE